MRALGSLRNSQSRYGHPIRDLISWHWNCSRVRSVASKETFAIRHHSAHFDGRKTEFEPSSKARRRRERQKTTVTRFAEERNCCRLQDSGDPDFWKPDSDDQPEMPPRFRLKPGVHLRDNNVPWFFPPHASRPRCASPRIVCNLTRYLFECTSVGPVVSPGP
jgi:hypothetical protein